MFDLRTKVVECLQTNYPHKMTAWQIAKWIIDNHPEDCAEKRGRSLQIFADDNDFISQIRSEIGAGKSRIQDKNPEVKITAERPRRYYYDKSISQNDELIMQNNDQQLQVMHPENVKRQSLAQKVSVTRTKEKTFTEHDLYPLLAQYVYREYGIS